MNNIIFMSNSISTNMIFVQKITTFIEQRYSLRSLLFMHKINFHENQNIQDKNAHWFMENGLFMKNGVLHEKAFVVKTCSFHEHVFHDKRVFNEQVYLSNKVVFLMEACIFHEEIFFIKIVFMHNCYFMEKYILMNQVCDHKHVFFNEQLYSSEITYIYVCIHTYAYIHVYTHGIYIYIL